MPLENMLPMVEKKRIKTKISRREKNIYGPDNYNFPSSIFSSHFVCVCVLLLYIMLCGKPPREP